MEQYGTVLSLDSNPFIRDKTRPKGIKGVVVDAVSEGTTAVSYDSSVRKYHPHSIGNTHFTIHHSTIGSIKTHNSTLLYSTILYSTLLYSTIIL
jgi:hypothetical protein